jgi:hypothetical protein
MLLRFTNHGQFQYSTTWHFANGPKKKLFWQLLSMWVTAELVLALVCLVGLHLILEYMIQKEFHAFKITVKNCDREDKLFSYQHQNLNRGTIYWTESKCGTYLATLPHEVFPNLTGFLCCPGWKTSSFK